MNRTYNLMQRIKLYILNKRISRNTTYLDRLIVQRKPDMLLQSLFANVNEVGEIIFRVDGLNRQRRELEGLLGEN